MAERPRIVFNAGLEGILDLRAGILKLEGYYFRFEGVLSQETVEYRLPKPGEVVLYHRSWENYLISAIVVEVR